MEAGDQRCHSNPDSLLVDGNDDHLLVEHVLVPCPPLDSVVTRPKFVHGCRPGWISPHDSTDRCRDSLQFPFAQFLQEEGAQHGDFIPIRRPISHDDLGGRHPDRRMSHFFDGFRRLRLLVYHMPGVSATSPLLQSELCDLPDAEFDHRIVEEIVIHHAISIAGSDIDFGTPRQWPWEEASTPSARLRILREGAALTEDPCLLEVDVCERGARARPPRESLCHVRPHRRTVSEACP